jgi:NTE family protein
MQPSNPPSSRAGLVLTGGGARAAYQVGVLKAIAELGPRGGRCPFPVITGTSAGAVSAIVLASHAAHFRRAVLAIEGVWRNFEVSQVLRDDALSMLRSGLHWLLALVTGGWLVPPPHAVFDNAPLWELLRRHLDFERIPRSLQRGHLRAVAVCATSYSDADSVAFYQGPADCEPWRRAFRKGTPVELTLEHLMASMAIPFLFRPVRIGEQFYGDGAMRQTAPLSAALHLGADRLLVIGVREPEGSAPTPRQAVEPTFGQMFGFMLDTLFMDQIVADIERLNSMNDGADAPHGVDRRTRHIQSLVITPSRELGDIARRHRHELPFTLRALLRTLGANDAGGQQLMSYMLFEKAFTRELIELGYADGLRRGAELREFLQIAPRSRRPRSRSSSGIVTPLVTQAS